MNGQVSPPSILSAHNFPTASCIHCPSKHVSGLQKLCLLIFPESTHFKLYLSKLSCFCPDVNDLALFSLIDSTINIIYVIKQELIDIISSAAVTSEANHDAAYDEDSDQPILVTSLSDAIKGENSDVDD